MSPTLQEALALTIQNRQQLATSNIDIQGRTLEQLRRWTRERADEAAREYTCGLLQETIPSRSSGGFIVAGHQPSLFHPGVWIKNFALDYLAHQTGAVGLNLVVDNDTLSSVSIRVPCGGNKSPTIEQFAFDRERPQQPWEAAEVLDEDSFRGFADRIARAMSQWNIVPLLAQLWPSAVDYLSHSRNLTDCLTAARSRLEHSWGLANLELPISQLCSLEPFLWFASHLFAHLDRFHQIHNRVLHEYKRTNRIRSHRHPVPNLQTTDGWLEAPFWVWKTGDQRRGRVFAKRQNEQVWLSNGTHVFAKLPLTPTMDACCAVEVLKTLAEQGLNLRTRALTTTLFARLCLGDLFVHGIGGAKYDEMTDRIMAQFFGIAPPAFLTLSATLHLPLSAGTDDDVEQFDITRLKTLKRELLYNADRHQSEEPDSGIDMLVPQKQRLIAEQEFAKTVGLSRNQRRKRARSNFERFQELQQITRQLSVCTTKKREAIDEEISRIAGRLQARAILQDREYASCLYPEEKIRAFLTGVWKT